MLPNRIAVYLTGVGNLLVGVAPFVVGFLDNPQEALAYVGAAVGMNAVVVTWLYNWGKWERDQASFDQPTNPPGLKR